MWYENADGLSKTQRVCWVNRCTQDKPTDQQEVLRMGHKAKRNIRYTQTARLQ